MSQENVKRNREEAAKRWQEVAIGRLRTASPSLVLATLTVRRDPTTGGADISFTLPCDSKIELKLTNATMETVYIHTGAYRQGSHSLLVDESVLQPGEYVVELRTCLGVLLRILRI